MNKIDNKVDINKTLQNNIKTLIKVSLSNGQDAKFAKEAQIENINTLIIKHKEEIDFKKLTDFLKDFEINIFNKNIQEAKNFINKPKPTNFEEKLERLFEDKLFNVYASNIYQVPELANDKLSILIKSENKPLSELIDKSLFARLVATTTTKLKYYSTTDEGYSGYNYCSVGVNYLAIEIIGEYFKDREKNINYKVLNDNVIGKNKPFKCYENKDEGETYLDDTIKDKTIFQVFAEQLKLYNGFQYGTAYSVSESYYENLIKTMRLFVIQSNINMSLINESKKTIIQIQEEINKDYKNYGGSDFKNINEEFNLLCATLGIDNKEKKKIKP